MSLDDKVNKVGKETQFFDEAELSQVMRQLDSDDINPETRMSSIDFNARLTRQEINASIVCDEFVRMGILPDAIAISRTRKRLSVSLGGLGRAEKVQIVTAEREGARGNTFMSGLKGLFTPKG